MFEIFVLFMLSGLIAVSAYSSQSSNISFFAKSSRSSGENATLMTATEQAIISQSAEEAPSFLEQLQGEIEATLFPRPTDSVLRRHYDTLVAVEVENRLSHFS